MYLNGKRRCPFCMDFGKRIEKVDKSFTCLKCEIVFDEFMIKVGEFPEYRDKYWN